MAISHFKFQIFKYLYKFSRNHHKCVNICSFLFSVFFIFLNSNSVHSLNDGYLLRPNANNKSDILVNIFSAFDLQDDPTRNLGVEKVKACNRDDEFALKFDQATLSLPTSFIFPG